ncbi:hypothetical protein FOZ60_004608 [Perkinsus olseni]|uniref:Uncharacterized protein n=1 Tax=Perkinsus olseni TaxID=32597 RepID=A0A7J6NSX0_PEROL|nr:hypothetical protein FOZ60_004608 [Perkinsus olseni]
MPSPLDTVERKSLQEAIRTLALTPDGQAEKRPPAWDIVKTTCKAHGAAAIVAAGEVIMKELLGHPNLRVRQRLLDNVIGKLVKSSVAARKWFLGEAHVLQRAAKSWGLIGERKQSAYGRGLRDAAVQHLSEWELHFGGKDYAAPLESLLASLRSRDSDAVPDRRHLRELSDAAQEERLIAVWKRVAETLRGAEMADIDHCITRIDNALEILFPTSLDEVFNEIDLDAELAKDGGDGTAIGDSAPSSSSTWIPDRNVTIKIQPGAASLAPQETEGENDAVFDQLRDDLRLVRARRWQRWLDHQRDAMAEVVTCGRLRGKPLPGASPRTGPQDLYSSPKACLAWLEEKRAGLDRVVGRALISTFNTTRAPGAAGTSKAQVGGQEEGRSDSEDESEYEGEFDDEEGGLSRDLRLCQQAFSAASPPPPSKKRKR